LDYQNNSAERSNWLLECTFAALFKFKIEKFFNILTKSFLPYIFIIISFISIAQFQNVRIKQASSPMEIFSCFGRFQSPPSHYLHSINAFECEIEELGTGRGLGIPFETVIQIETRCTREQECDCTCRRNGSRKIRWCICRRAPRDPRHILPSAGSARSTRLWYPYLPLVSYLDLEDGLRNTPHFRTVWSDGKKGAARGATLISSSDPKCIEPITEFVVTNERWMWRNTPAGNRTKCW